MTGFDYKFLDADNKPFEGPSGPKVTLRIVIDVAEPKDAAKVLSHLQSPTFRAHLDGLKPQLGLGNYGMGTSRVYPLVKETNGDRVPVGYCREIQFSRSI